MVDHLLLAGSALLLVEGVGYGWAGTLIGERQWSDPAVSHARRFFAAWWYGIGANKAMAGAYGLAAAVGLLSNDAYETLLILNFIVLAVSLGCLLYYLLFLLSGRRGWMLPVFTFYVAFFFLLTYNVLRQGLVGFEISGWRLNPHYEDPSPSPLGIIVLAILLLPQVIGALAYFTLFFRIDDRRLRFRIALVSWSIIAWTLSLAFVTLPGLAARTPFQISSRLVGVLAAVACVVAYAPPAWLRRRLGLPDAWDSAAPGSRAGGAAE